MKPFFPILSLLSLLSLMPASAEDFERLRSSYTATVVRAIQPSRQNYEKELNRLIEARTRSSDLKGALDAQKVLRQLTVPSGEDEENDLPIDDKEIDRLRTAYEKEAERVTGPLREIYLRELAKLMDTRTRSADLAGALVVKAELDRATEEKERQEADPIEAFFVGRTWVSEAGTAFTFEKGGKCIRQSGQRREGTWRRDRSIVISSLENSPGETRYFRFESKTKAHYGTAKDAIEHPVFPK